MVDLRTLLRGSWDFDSGGEVPRWDDGRGWSPFVRVSLGRAAREGNRLGGELAREEGEVTGSWKWRKCGGKPISDVERGRKNPAPMDDSGPAMLLALVSDCLGHSGDCTLAGDGERESSPSRRVDC